MDGMASARATQSGATDVEAARNQPDPSRAPSTPATPERKIPRWRLISVATSLSVGLFLSLMDSTIVATSLVAIGTDFNKLRSVTWVALAYTLAYVGFAVLFARLSDVFGRRNAFTAAYVIFMAFSIGCGFATSLDQLVAFRAVQGVGGSGLYSLTMVIFPEIVPLEKRKYIGTLVGLIVAVSGVLGPVLGGVITHYSSWRWIFWINAPIGIIPAILMVVAWPTESQMYHAKRCSILQVDFIGCILLLAASVLVVFAFQEGGLGSTGNIWRSALFIGPLSVGCVCWFVLLGWEGLVRRVLSIPPLLPMNLLRQRVYLSGVLCTITTGFVYFVVVYSLPIHIQVVNQKSALIAGVDMLPMLGSAAVGSMLGGVLNGKRNNIFPILMFGSCCMALGAGLLSTISSLEIGATLFGYQVLVGMGFGLTVSNVTMLAIIESGLEEHAVSQGVVAQARILGGSIGIAASTAILGVIERRNIAAMAAFHEHGRDVDEPKEHFVIRQSYSEGFQRTMQVTTIIACLTIILCLGTFQKHPITMAERGKQLYMQKMKEQSEKAALAAAAASES